MKITYDKHDDSIYIQLNGVKPLKTGHPALDCKTYFDKSGQQLVGIQLFDVTKNMDFSCIEPSGLEELCNQLKIDFKK